MSENPVDILSEHDGGPVTFELVHVLPAGERVLVYRVVVESAGGGGARYEAEEAVFEATANDAVGAFDKLARTSILSAAMRRIVTVASLLAAPSLADAAGDSTAE